MTTTEHPEHDNQRKMDTLSEHMDAQSARAEELYREYATQVIRERNTVEQIHVREDFDDPTQQRAFCVTHAVSLCNGLHLWKDKEDFVESARNVVEMAKILHDYVVGEPPPKAPAGGSDLPADGS